VVKVRDLAISNNIGLTRSVLLVRVRTPIEPELYQGELVPT